MKYSYSHQNGLTLIESLVALVILALGVLGLAGVQTRVLVENRTTNSRAIAIGLIDDLNNRMLLNRDAAVGLPISPGVPAEVPSAYATAAFIGAPAAASASAPDPLDCRPSTGNPVICSPAQLAQYDLMAWRRAVAAAFPNGQVFVFNSPTDRRQIGIAIAWPANESALANAAPDATATAPFAITAAGRGGVQCPATFICHIVYAQP